MFIFSPLLYLLTFLRTGKEHVRILVIQTAKIGDVICSTPLFREIKQYYPSAHLSVLVSPSTKELLECNPYVNQIIPIESRYYKGLMGKFKLAHLICEGNYNIAICLNPNIPFTFAVFFGLVPKRLSVMPNFAGVTFRLASIFYTFLEEHTSGRLITETYVRLLKGMGIESNYIAKEVYKSLGSDEKVQHILRSNTNAPLVGIAVSSGNKLKELGPERLVKLIHLLCESVSAHVVLIGSQQDKRTASVILAATQSRYSITDTTGCITLKELPALIEKLSLFIGVDTGITYMADALAIPIIHLAGPIDTSEQRPVGERVRVIQSKVPCAPCTYVFKAAYNCKQGSKICIEAISLDNVCEYAKELLLEDN